MIRADIPQDVTEYKEQFFLGMTGRQILCVVLMLVLAVGTFLIGKNFVTTDILVYLIVLEVAPLAAVGFLKYNGMGFEKIIVQVTDFYVGNQHRKISYLPEETEIHDKVREIALSAAEKERKAELKQRKKDNKALKKAEKIERRKRNARRNKRGNNGGNC
ncbi:MAG: PrgI family protein [Oscillospiraceae bacterium]|nr:PrgI family protein [Oscillospiraceae bacterium]